MLELSLTFAVSAFIAGLLMFLAPCTLPLVPAYLAFIGGVNQTDIQGNKKNQRKIRINAVTFVFGFSVIFISFGILAGFFGSFFGPYRVLLSHIGGFFVILFGLMTLNIIHFIPLAKEYKIQLPLSIQPGSPWSAFLIGSIFALGWTPCVGPVLASILLLATTKATIYSGAILLALFSAGLAVPFIATAVLYAKISVFIVKYATLAKSINVIGGLFLIGIGLLLLSGNFSLTVSYGYKVFYFFGIANFLEFY